MEKPASMTACGLTIEKRLSGVADTARLGEALAAALRSGDVILLSGPLGSGKSALARSVVRALTCRDEPVPSPTFTLVQTYRASQFDIWHLDLYRLSDPSEASELGLEEAMGAGVLLVEWPQRLDGDWPKDRLEITLSADADAATDTVEDEPRTALLRAYGSWIKRLNELSHEF